ncbi:MAG TPA: hypothetical protein VFC00_07480 [Micromonosporaceae bacterium]|nr:hypothetical protein [Micromonosporaceae bacterium]
MTTRRRLAAAAAGVLALLALPALAGCRVEPGAAAFVGDLRIPEQRVDEIVGSVGDRVPAEQRGGFRQEVVSMLVLIEAGTRYAQAQEVQLAQAQPATVAERLKLPVGAAYTQLVAHYRSVMTALEGRATPAAPSEADQREAFANATIDGQPVTNSFDQVRQFFNEETMGAAVGNRNLLAEVLRGADVAVSPRYAPVVHQVRVTIANAQSWLGVPLGDAVTDPAVVDRG